ncbi:MAG TPA: hypothetical protein VFQ88_07655 [Nevskiaceae bacterium]|nr:hypothetical protein [Nevskiaceae bacterium]
MSDPCVAELGTGTGERFAQRREGLLHSLGHQALLRNKGDLNGRAIHVEVHRKRSEIGGVQLELHVLWALLHHLYDLLADLMRPGRAAYGSRELHRGCWGGRTL